jgi:hypothetical protein
MLNNLLSQLEKETPTNESKVINLQLPLCHEYCKHRLFHVMKQNIENKKEI